MSEFLSSPDVQQVLQIIGISWAAFLVSFLLGWVAADFVGMLKR